MDAITFSLPQSLDISIVNESKESMIEQLHCDTPITQVNIDVSELARIDTAGLQLLAALVIDINRQNIELSWLNLNDELVDSATRLGLDNLLKLN